MALDPLSQQTVDLLAGAVTAKQNIITALRNKEAVVPDNARLADLPPIIAGIETEPDDIRQFMIEKSIEQSHGGGLIAGNLDCGYCGSVLGAEMGTFDNGPAEGQNVTASSLALATGVSEGIAFNHDIIWHKFIRDSEVILVAQKPIRHSVSWTELASNNCVFGGKVVSIGGVKYRVTLLRGLSAECVNYTSNNGSEWNDLLIPLTDGRFANLTLTDLGVKSGNGYYSWCQDTTIGATTVGDSLRIGLYRSRRGGGSVTGADDTHASVANKNFGWRPALRFTF